MSTLSPATRLRTKTSDLTDFFRGSTHSTSSSSSTRPGSQLRISTPASNGPEVQEALPSPKKKSSRIPFLGRPRKKSQPTAIPPMLNNSQFDGKFTDYTADSFDRPLEEHYDLPSTNSVSTTATAVQHSTSGLASLSASTSSLGSKIVAHLNPGRSRKATIANNRKSLPPPPELAKSTDTLSPPLSSPVRSASFESSSSGTDSRNRSPTPKASQPVIAASLGSDSLEQYADLFTRPKKRIAPIISAPPPPSKESSRNLNTSTSTLDTLQRNPSITVQSPAETDSAAKSVESSSRHRRKESPKLVSASSDSNSRRPPLSSQPPLPQGNNVEANSQQKSLAISTSQSSSMLAKPKPTIKRLSAPMLTINPENGSPVRTRSIPTSPTTGPPTIPLPPPPTKSPPPASRPSTTGGIAANATQSPRRIRANTVETIMNVPVPPNASPSQGRPSANPVAVPPPYQTPSSPTDQQSAHTEPNATLDLKEVSRPIPIEPIRELDVESATPEEIKAELEERKRQYTRLANYLLKITALHIQEKMKLEKTVLSLERENFRREKENKGLTWLVMNGNGNGNGSGPSSTAQSRSPSTFDSENCSPQGTPRSQSPASSKMSVNRRFQYQHTDESGAESHPTSGAESIRGSGASGSESPLTFRTRRIRRAESNARAVTTGGGTPAVPSANSIGTLSRSSSIKRAPSTSTSTRSSFATEVSIGDVSQASKRSSISSYLTTTSTATSASGSTALTSPSSSSTCLALTAIPEAPSPPPKPPTPPAKEERRSTSSRPSTSIPTSARKARPPSIAQVLERSPATGDVLEKLRPFGNSSR